MRVVLDTNILLGALITPGGTPDRIYRAWRASRFDLVTSSEQLEELKRASRYPKLKAVLPAHRAGTMINNLRRSVVMVSAGSVSAGIELRDPHDAFLLTIAITAGRSRSVITDSAAAVVPPLEVTVSRSTDSGSSEAAASFAAPMKVFPRQPRPSGDSPAAPLVGCAVNYVTLAWLGRQRRVSSQGPPSTRTALRVDHCGPR